MRNQLIQKRFPVRDTRLSNVTRALGHPARLRILRLLAERRSCVCGEIVQMLPLSQSTVSGHLKELREIGLIKGEIEGPKSCYCIDWKGIRKLRADLGRFFETLQKFETENDCC